MERQRSSWVSYGATGDVHDERATFAVGSPGGVPLILGLGELEHGGVGPVQPWLAAYVVREPSVGTADGEGQDQIKG